MKTLTTENAREEMVVALDNSPDNKYTLKMGGVVDCNAYAIPLGDAPDLTKNRLFLGDTDRGKWIIVEDAGESDMQTLTIDNLGKARSLRSRNGDGPIWDITQVASIHSIKLIHREDGTEQWIGLCDFSSYRIVEDAPEPDLVALDQQNPPELYPGHYDAPQRTLQAIGGLVDDTIAWLQCVPEAMNEDIAAFTWVKEAHKNLDKIQSLIGNKANSVRTEPEKTCKNCGNHGGDQGAPACVDKEGREFCTNWVEQYEPKDHAADRMGDIVTELTALNVRLIAEYDALYGTGEVADKSEAEVDHE